MTLADLANQGRAGGECRGRVQRGPCAVVEAREALERMKVVLVAVVGDVGARPTERATKRLADEAQPTAFG